MKKRKNVILIATLLLATVLMNAQETAIVKMMPQHAQGYLVLNADVDIDYWTVEILKRTYFSDGTYLDEIQERNELVGKNYFKISEYYIDDCGQPGYGYLINTTAHYSSGVSVSEQGDMKFPTPSNLPAEQAYGSVHEWKCNGNTYAWGIHQLLSNYFNNSYFNLTTTYKSYNSGITEYYYQYFSEYEWAIFTSQIYANPLISGGVPYYQYYNVPGNNLVIDGMQVIKVENDPGICYKNQYGVEITGQWVFGIAKGLGQWAGLSGQSCTWTPYLVYGNSMGAMSKTWAISVINQHANLTGCGAPLLQCIDGSFTDPFGGIGDGLETIDQLTEADLDSIIIVYGETEEIADVLDPAGDDWWNNFLGVSIVDLTGNSGEIFNGKIADMRDEDGFVTSPSISINPGLYAFSLQRNDGAYFSIIKEYSSEDNTSGLSGSFTYTIYPVPINNNQFSIDVLATAKLEVLYKIFDLNSNLLYESRIFIEKDESKTLVIEPEVQLPEGFLVNQFVFMDGSQLSSITQNSNN